MNGLAAVLGCVLFAATAFAQPVINAISPPAGPVGTVVTIDGTGFTGVTQVTFAPGMIASFTFVSDIQITATVPGSAMDGAITVTTPGGSANSSSFMVMASPPMISSFSPTSGSVGSVVSLFGSGLTGTTTVSFTPAMTTSFS
ncbi:MAG: IPT/TIG domain-containing protein, partial [Thermoanaerobaculia bacterium]